MVGPYGRCRIAVAYMTVHTARAPPGLHLLIDHLAKSDHLSIFAITRGVSQIPSHACWLPTSPLSILVRNVTGKFHIFISFIEMC